MQGVQGLNQISPALFAERRLCTTAEYIIQEAKTPSPHTKSKTKQKTASSSDLEIQQPNIQFQKVFD